MNCLQTEMQSQLELDEKAKAQGISQRTMREARSRMKEELDYRMNEKQGKYHSIKNKGECGDGRILECER